MVQRYILHLPYFQRVPLVRKNHACQRALCASARKFRTSKRQQLPGQTLGVSHEKRPQARRANPRRIAPHAVKPPSRHCRAHCDKPPRTPVLGVVWRNPRSGCTPSISTYRDCRQLFHAAPRTEQQHTKAHEKKVTAHTPANTPFITACSCGCAPTTHSSPIESNDVLYRAHACCKRL